MYKKAFEISLRRFHKFNSTLIDEYIVLINNDGSTVHSDMDYNVIRKLRDLWIKGETNILYAEVDTLCHGSTEEIFNLEKFTMFSKCSAPDPEEYNSGVLYFPAVMNKDVWDAIMVMHKQWNPHWAYFQKIFDTAFKMQGPVYENKKYNSFTDLLNPIITHHFSSRGIHKLLKIYQDYISEDPVPPFREY
jgi:hypothetical protein